MSQFQGLQNFYIEQEIEEEKTHISFEDSKDKEINEEIENRNNNNEQEEIKFTQNSENKRLSSPPKKYQTYKMDFKEKIVMEVIKL